MGVSGEVRLEIDGAIATLTLSNPPKKNALTWAMYENIEQHLNTIRNADGVSAVILRGEGGTFASGTDIRQFEGFAGTDGIEYERRIDRIVKNLLHLPKATVAMIQGHAVGGGLALAGACDLRYASDDALLGLPIARTLGNCLSFQNYRRLSQLIGPMRLKELIFTGRLINAAKAMDIGFLTEVFDSGELEQRVRATASLITEGAPMTIWATKEALSLLERRSEAQNDSEEFEWVIKRVYGSQDFANAVKSRMLKEPVRWQGR